MEWAAALLEAEFGLIKRENRERVKLKVKLEIAGGDSNRKDIGTTKRGVVEGSTGEKWKGIFSTTTRSGQREKPGIWDKAEKLRGERVSGGDSWRREKARSCSLCLPGASGGPRWMGKQPWGHHLRQSPP